MRKFKGITLILIILVSLGAFSPFLQAGKCEEALSLCLHDPINQLTLTGPVSCGLGYLFCKKYIES